MINIHDFIMKKGTLSGISVEAESATGEIVNRTEEVSIGDRVDKKR
jgi:hypothetical protein